MSGARYIVCTRSSPPYLPATVVNTTVHMANPLNPLEKSHPLTHWQEPFYLPLGSAKPRPQSPDLVHHYLLQNSPPTSSTTYHHLDPTIFTLHTSSTTLSTPNTHTTSTDMAPENPACYKCGQTDHVASNRNCPRLRKTSTAPAPAPRTRRNSSAPVLPATPAAPPAEKTLRDAREGDPTRFWYWKEEASESEDGDDHDGSQIQDPIDAKKGKDTWKKSDPAMRRAFGLDKLATPKADDGKPKLFSGKQKSAKKVDAADGKPKAVAGKRKHITKDDAPLAKRKKQATALEEKNTAHKSGKKLGNNHGGETAQNVGERTTTNEPGIYRLDPRQHSFNKDKDYDSSSSLSTLASDMEIDDFYGTTQPPDKTPEVVESFKPKEKHKALPVMGAHSKRVKKAQTKDIEEPPKRSKNADLVLTPEYEEWLDRPENDPLQNWKGTGAEHEFEYVGSRNKTFGPGRVRYQRGVQGWRESRSEGGGLGHPFPGGPHPGTW
jgi:hypothetical protein